MFGPLFRKTMICGVIAIFDIGCMPLMIVNGLMACPDQGGALWVIPCIAGGLWALIGIPVAGIWVQAQFHHDTDDPKPIQWTRYIASFEWFCGKF